MRRLIDLEFVPAQILIGHLLAAGIPAMETNTTVEGECAGIFTGLRTVWVSGEVDRTTLGSVMEEIDLGRLTHSASDCCPRCRYDLRGHDGDGVCPECGETCRAPALDRTCPGCGEDVPDTFEICWNCSSPADLPSVA